GKNDGFSEEKTPFLEGKDQLFETLIASVLRDGVNNKFEFRHTEVKIAYPQSAKTKKERPKPREKTLLMSQLSLEEKSALKLLHTFGSEDLTGLELIGESQVKRSFRYLALRYHPDRQGPANVGASDGSDFRRIEGAYRVLATAFRKTGKI